MNAKRILIVLGPILVLLLSGSVLYAQGPAGSAHIQAALGPAFTYQGRLKDAGGDPVADTCAFRFSLWDAGTGGNQIGSDSEVAGVAVSDGYFAVQVNGGGEFGSSAFTGEARWLEVEVQCSGDVGYVLLDPRQPLSAAPYALGLRPGTVVSGAVGGGDSILKVLNDDPGGRGLYGAATATTGSAIGVRGSSDAETGYGVYGIAHGTGAAYGVYGRATSGAGYGVYGYAAASDGTTYGVYGRSDSSARAYGVYGEATAVSGPTHGVWGVSKSTGGIGVAGVAEATVGTTYGVAGYSWSSEGHGVYGFASATEGAATGVYGVSNSSVGGKGVLGVADVTTGSGVGVYGLTQSPEGYGVFYSGGLGGIGLLMSIVETPDYGWRHLYTIESPGNWVEDFGTAQLVAGRAAVTIEPVFAQTVNLEEPYQVFFTPVAGEPVVLFVSSQTSTSFTVGGVTLSGKPADCSFHYRIVAQRLGYENLRLAPAQDPTLGHAAIESPAERGAQP